MEKPSGISRARVSADGVEVEVEGVDLNIPELVAQVIETRRSLGPAATSTTQSAPNLGEAIARQATASTNTIASLLNASTGSDLVLAAMAHLTLVQGKDVAMRREILDEMKAARTFYKETFSSNLSSYLDNLAKAKRLNLVARDSYALPNGERQNLERLISSAS
ncbi:MAG TPA: hypothetical protein VG943_18875 [Caulobacterales bacterium]|nr:hypothetical protein [Caulobacterales bacterium]